MERYKIVRFYSNGKKRIMHTGLTLEEAKEHCNKPNTKGITRNGIRWFDGFTIE